MSKPRRVMLVSAVGNIGGGEEVLLALVRHLPAFGYAADVVCLRPGPLADAARAAGAAFVAEGRAHRMRDFGELRAARRWLAETIADRRPAVVHSNHMAHLYARGPARRGGAKEVWHVHDYPHHVDWADRLCRLVPTDAVMFTTPFVRSGYPLVRRRFASHVIAPAAPAMPPPSAGDVRSRLGLPAGATLFLTATRLQPHKGHHTLLAAIARLNDDPTPMAFVITGQPADDRQAAYFQELQLTAGRLKIGGRVFFVGRVSDEDLAALYAESRALVHPAYTEGFGLALVNAMRAGLAVIAADAEGPKFVLDGGALGMLVPRHDAAALADAVARHLTRPPDVGTLREIASLAVTRFSAEHMAERVAAVYDGLLKLGASSARVVR